MKGCELLFNKDMYDLVQTLLNKKTGLKKPYVSTIHYFIWNKMALLAETLVEEWLNRNGYFTIRGIKQGVDEIDMLAVRPSGTKSIDAMHVEVQASFRPVSYLSKLTKRLTKELGKEKGSAWKMPHDVLQECVNEWVQAKFTDPAKIKRRDALWPSAYWELVLVHGIVKHSEELKLIQAAGIRLVALEQVINELCSPARPSYTATGSDLVDLIEFFATWQKKQSGNYA